VGYRDLTGRYEIKKAGVNPDAYETVYTLSENDFYYIFSKDVPDMLINKFQQALGMVRNQKDATGNQRIRADYLPVPGGWMHPTAVQRWSGNGLS